MRDGVIGNYCLKVDRRAPEHGMSRVQSGLLVGLKSFVSVTLVFLAARLSLPDNVPILVRKIIDSLMARCEKDKR